MKTHSETAAASKASSPSRPFFAKAGQGGFFAPAVQAKMEVSKPGDSFEQEAEGMADRVMRMSAPSAQAGVPPTAPPPRLQKQEDEDLRRMAGPDEALWREGGGAPAVSAETQAAITGKSGGEPLSGELRGFMEPRFGADFGNVRVHADAEAARLSSQLGARAFTYRNQVFFAQGQYQPGSSEGRHLLAHELTHVVQQGQALRRSTPPTLQRLGVQDALDKFADWAGNIPGFRLLSLLLGFNPVSRRAIDRNAANLLRAMVELLPGGAFITQALDNHGLIPKAAAWVEQKLALFAGLGGAMVASLQSFIAALGWSDLLSLGGVWERAKPIFTGPIARIVAFGGGLVVGLLGMAKEAILKPLAALARGTRGYGLLAALLGADPLTGEPVPRDVDTLLGGFLRLVGQEEVFENLKKGHAISRAWAWFEAALVGLAGFARSVPQRLAATLAALSFRDLVGVAGALGKLAGAFAAVAGQFFQWGLGQVAGLLEILFSVVAPGVLPYLKKAQGAFLGILKNPVGFVGNLVRAGRSGFGLFAANIAGHLKAALVRWIAGPLGDLGGYIPKSFELGEIAKLLLSVLGLSWQAVRGKLLKIIPEPVLAGLEKTADILVTLAKDGPAAAWEQVKAELGELKTQLIAQITEMVSGEVVKAAVTKLVSLLNPAGAVIQAILAIYNTISFFAQKLQQIAAVAATFIDSIAAIAAGQVDGAARRVEQTLANTLNLAVAFFAKFAGLGNIPDKIAAIIGKLRQPVDKALDKIVEWLALLLGKAKGAARAGLEAAADWWKERLGFANVDGERHTLFFKNLGGAEPEMMIASKESTVKTYLDNYPDKKSEDYQTAKSVFEDTMKIIYTPAKTSDKESRNRKKVVDGLAKISVAFANLGGEPPEADDYEPRQVNDDNGVPPHVNTVEHLKTPIKMGTEPRKTRNSGTLGWAEVVDDGLTRRPDFWVQMHVISAQLGGRGIPGNLVPAPKNINSGHFRTFEHGVLALANKTRRMGSKRLKNVVWVRVEVTYDGVFAKSISGIAGLYFWRGKKARQKWVKNTVPTLSAATGIPHPSLYITNKISLNFGPGPHLRKLTSNRALVRLIKYNRPYVSFVDFCEKISDKAAKERVSGYEKMLLKAAQEFGLGNVVLNDEG